MLKNRCGIEEGREGIQRATEKEIAFHVIVHPHPNPPPSRGREYVNVINKYPPSPGANPYPQIEGRLGMVALEKALGVSL